jgi:hypothetical protein
MTRTNCWIFMVLLSIVLNLGGVFAQPGNGGGPGPGGAGGGPEAGAERHGFAGIIPPRVVLVRVLELSDEQLAQVQELVEEIQNTLGPLREEIAMLKEELKAELGMETPDPLVVGDIVIALHDLRGQVAAIRAQLRAEFLAILTEEQLAKLREFIDSHSPRGGEDDEEDGA